MLRVRLLGPIEVMDGERVVPVPGSRRASVLATLALRPGDLVSVDRIIDAVWEDGPPATARNTVQSHIAYLRRLLGSGDADAAGSALVGRPPGYLLTLPAPATDLVEVETVLAEAATSRDPAERVPLYEAALSRWHGNALDGAGGSGYLRRHADRLDTLRVTTTESLLADRLRLGRHQDALPDLEHLVAEHPLRERPAQLLITGLYRAGRAAEALAAYDRLVASLRRELDAAPSRSLVTLRDRVRDGDRALLVPAGRGLPQTARSITDLAAGQTTRTDGPADERRHQRHDMRTAPVRRHMTRLVGRQVELTDALAMLERSRVVTLVGMGGVGKTRLAWEILDRAPGSGPEGVERSFVDLSAIEVGGLDLARLEAFVATEVGLPLDQSQPIHTVLAAALGVGERLLVLDNCEALVEPVADLVEGLLARTQHLRILATSREPLHVDGEECLLLAPLPVATDAVELLADRARAADPAFVAGPQNRDTLEQLCRAVDGLPLALEILGPRLRSLTPTELAEGLETRLLSWRDARRGVSDRQRTIGSLMEWSYQLLGTDEVDALDALATLRGGAWLTDAVDLCGPDRGTGEELLLGLIDRSLVTRTEVDGRSRVSLHALVRAYAASRVAESGRQEELAERHTRWVEQLVTTAGSRWHTDEESAQLRWLVADDENLRAALAWRRDHRPERLPALVTGLWWYWFRSGVGSEGLAWAREAVSPTRHTEASDPAVATAHAAAGYLAWLTDSYDEAEVEAQAALAVAGDRAEVVGFAHGVIARARGDRGDFAAATEHAQRSIASYESVGDAWGVAWSRRLLAGALLFGGQVAEAEVACALSRRAFEALGDGWGLAGACDLAAQVAAAQGHREAALALAQEAVVAHRACGDRRGERYALQHLAQASWELGDVAGAGSYAAECLSLCESLGFEVGQLQAIQLLEDVRAAEGDRLGAEQLAGRAARTATDLGPAAEVSLAIAARRRQSTMATSGDGGLKASGRSAAGTG